MIDLSGQPKRGIRSFTQSNKPEDERLKRITFDGEDQSYDLLSRDGQMLCFYIYACAMARVYRVTEEAGKDPVAFIKFELDGKVLAVNGKGNCVIVENEDWFEMHDIFPCPAIVVVLVPRHC